MSRQASLAHGELRVEHAATGGGVSEVERLELETPEGGAHAFWSQQSVVYENGNDVATASGATETGASSKKPVIGRGIIRPKDKWPKPDEEHRAPAPEGLEWCHFGDGDVHTDGGPAVELDEILALQFSDAPDEEAASPLGGYHFLPSREMLWRSLSRPGTDRQLWVALRLGEDGVGGLAPRTMVAFLAACIVTVRVDGETLVAAEVKTPLLPPLSNNSDIDVAVIGR